MVLIDFIGLMIRFVFLKHIKKQDVSIKELENDLFDDSLISIGITVFVIILYFHILN